MDIPGFNGELGTWMEEGKTLGRGYDRLGQHYRRFWKTSGESRETHEQEPRPHLIYPSYAETKPDALKRV